MRVARFAVLGGPVPAKPQAAYFPAVRISMSTCKFTNRRRLDAVLLVQLDADRDHVAVHPGKRIEALQLRGVDHASDRHDLALQAGLVVRGVERRAANDGRQPGSTRLASTSYTSAWATICSRFPMPGSVSGQRLARPHENLQHRAAGGGLDFAQGRSALAISRRFRSDLIGIAATASVLAATAAP